MIPLIKLDAIDSTNEFLKRWTHEHSSQSALAVLADYQNNGKGQRGNHWVSEPSKNLILSVYMPLSGVLASSQFSINMAVSLAVVQVLHTLKIPELAVKWPNDILSCQQKIGGILIETTIKKRLLESVIVGIGLNVNQTSFIGLPKAGSLASLTNKKLNIDDLCRQLLFRIETLFADVPQINLQKLHQDYEASLFRYQQISQFKNSNGVEFKARIVGVNQEGQLELETDSGIECFSMKEISLIW